jgi:hypothetical protein
MQANIRRASHRFSPHRAPVWITFTCMLLAIPTARADLVLRYTFDESSGPALDSGAAPATNGTFTGLATRVANTPGATGYALNLNFSGVGNYLTCGNPDKLNNLSNLTLVTWINLQGNPVLNDRLIDKLSTTGGFGWVINNTTANSVQFRFLANATTGPSAISTANVNLTNRWVFLALTYDSTVTSNNVRYYSGTTASAVAQLGNALNFNQGIITNTANDFRVGSTPASASDRTPPAWYDDVRVYNTVLSQTDLESVRLEALQNAPAQIATQPANQTVYDGAAQVTFAATVGGADPVYKQWFFNLTNAIADATNASLTLTNVTSSRVGTYSLFVSNAYTPAGAWSSNATLTLLPLYNTAQMSNIWNLVPGDRPYITGTSSNAAERGLIFNNTTSNLLLVSRAPAASVVVLDPQTGAEKYFMDVTGVGSDVPGSLLALNMIGVGDDGVVYAGNVSVNAGSQSYNIYRWPDDSSNNAPVLVFAGDPGAGVAPNLRWGDNMAVRGAGANSQILLAPGTGTNVVLLQTSSGLNFQTEIQPAVIAISGVPSAFAQVGLAFGPGTNTFWAKTPNQQLYLVQFDLNSNTGAVLYAYPGTAVPGSVRGISTDPTQRWLAGVAVESAGDNARLYDVSDLVAGPVLMDQELFATHNANTTVGGPAYTTFGGNYVFALNSNNGIKAFLINTNYLPPFRLTSVAASDVSDVVLTWQSVAGHSYQVQFKDSLAASIWSNASLSITATGAATSFTNTVPGASRFYRVYGQ